MSRAQLIQTVRELERLLARPRGLFNGTSCNGSSSSSNKLRRICAVDNDASIASMKSGAIANAINTLAAGEEAMRDWDSAVRSLGLSKWAKTPLVKLSKDPSKELHEESLGVVDEADSLLKRTTVSKLLTYPLTVARHARHLAGEAVKRNDGDVSKPVRLAVVGARAESTLPSLFWQQLGIVTGLRWELTFIGPQTGPPGGPPHLAPGTEPMVTFSHKFGMYHECFSMSDLPYDGFCLFNSGIGHPKEGLNWEHTITMLQREQGKPALFTSFNMKDFERDQVVLKRIGTDISRFERHNPVRSLSQEHLANEKVYTNFSATLTHF